MLKPIILLFSLTTQILLFAQDGNLSTKKIRHFTYSDFMAKYSINDTSAAVIELFFDKKENTALAEMSFLPVTTLVFLVLPKIALGLTIISLPFFIHGSIVLIKYRKKRLQKILMRYKKDLYLPKGLRRKTNKLIDYYQNYNPDN